MKTITNIIQTAFASFVLVGVATLPDAQAVVPPPDGGYPGFNTAEGQNALFSRTTGTYNTAAGWFSLRALTGGAFNTAIGAATLLANTADQNTATGAAALLSNTTGTQNTANGAFALFSNTTDSFNTATGFQALFSNTGDGGHNNVATGYQALYSNTTGRRNTANGSSALYTNTTGILNTALGDQALYSNIAGSFHTAIGWGALASHSSGEAGSDANTAVGESALVNHTTGGGNTAVGESVLVSHITGHQNIALGYAAGQDLTDGNVNIYISNPGVPAENTTIRIGNVVAWTDIYGFPHPAHTATYVAGISGTAVVGDTVVVDANGQLGTATSSARFKKEIKPMDKTSEAILALEPVSFRYKSDSKGTPQFGLIAEEVAKVNPDLVVRDHSGEIYSVRYEAVNAMLLNEFLKAHQKVHEQQATIAQLKSNAAKQELINAQQQKGMEALAAQLKEQALEIQKVNDKIELQKPSAHTVADNE